MKRTIKDWQKALCGVLAASVLAVGGFMGVQQFMPKERSLTIVDDVAVATSRQVTTAETEKSGETGSERNDASGTDEGVGSGGNGGGLQIDAKSAVLIDGSSGKVLFAQNEKKHLPPASVTKVMTLLLVLEACDAGKLSYDDKVTVSERAAGMGGSQMYMEPGEQHTVEELLKGVIMVSANDGCVTLEKKRIWERIEMSKWMKMKWCYGSGLKKC